MAALALPVADGVVHEVELRESAKILNRKYRGEHGLQARIFALARQAIHLQEALVGFLLDVNQIGNLNGGFDFGKIQPFPFPRRTVSIAHSELPLPFRGCRHAQQVETPVLRVREGRVARMLERKGASSLANSPALRI